MTTRENLISSVALIRGSKLESNSLKNTQKEVGQCHPTRKSNPIKSMNRYSVTRDPRREVQFQKQAILSGKHTPQQSRLKKLTTLALASERILMQRQDTSETMEC